LPNEDNVSRQTIFNLQHQNDESRQNSPPHVLKKQVRFVIKKQVFYLLTIAIFDCDDVILVLHFSPSANWQPQLLAAGNLLHCT